jgi:glycosyltransferase involved in cell wall biosynthesis
VVPSEYLAGIVSGWGVSDAALCVVHNAIELPSTYSHNRTFDTPLFTLMTASRLVPWKYVEGLIALLPRLFDLHCECRLLIAGDGPERARLEAFASSLSVASSVVFLGAIPRTRVLELVSISDIFLLNSDYEGFSHVLLEAMSLGSVIVARASGGNKELITNGCNGYLMDSAAPHAAWADLIRDLLRDSTRRARISCAARARSEQFTFKRMADETLAHI